MSRSNELTLTGQCFDSAIIVGDSDECCDVNARIRLNLRKSTLEQRSTTFRKQIQKLLNSQTQPSISDSNGVIRSYNLSTYANNEYEYNDYNNNYKQAEQIIIKKVEDNNHQESIKNTLPIRKQSNESIDILTNIKSREDKANSMSKLLAINPPTSADHEIIKDKQVVLVHCCQDLNNLDDKIFTNACLRRQKSSRACSSSGESPDAYCHEHNHEHHDIKFKEHNHSSKRIKCIKDVIEGRKEDEFISINQNNNNQCNKNSKNYSTNNLEQQDELILLNNHNKNNNNSKMIVDKYKSINIPTRNSKKSSTIDLSTSPPTFEQNKTMAREVEQQQQMDKDEEPPSPSYSPRSRTIQRHNLVSLGSDRNNSKTSIFNNKHMPWFGIDVGGTLVKVVFFDPKDATTEELITLKRIRRYLKSSKPYGTSGKRDSHLEMPNCIINKRIGTLHFIRFASNRMSDFLKMAKNKRFADTIHNVCATGGGAYKFEDDIKNNLGITLHKTDELDSIIYGIHYIDKYNSDRECYFLEDPLDDDKCIKVPYDFSRPYPYLVVNIGSGVSILAVYSSTSYSRISGSSIGGGTFLGLCCLLTQCETFDEAIKLAKAGSSSKIDKLVKDIYGGDYPKFNLSGDTVASCFGHMNIADKRKDVKREDLARALLEMITINIGLIARMCAEKEDIDRVVFIGNFLRVNQLSMKLLSYAVNYWSKGAMKALFLEHEGYFGAVGCFVESTQGCHYS